MNTNSQSKEDAIADRHWLLVDATDKTVGRIASEVAKLIRGKHKPCFTRHVDCGDYVIVINADKVKFTGRKIDQKFYSWHTGYIGGVKSFSARDMLAKHPERVVERAVKGMLPRGALGHQMIKKLKVYAGAEHPHTAQNPEVYQPAL